MNNNHLLLLSVLFVTTIIIVAYSFPYKIVFPDKKIIITSSNKKYYVYKTKREGKKIYFLLEKTTGRTAYIIEPGVSIYIPYGKLIKKIGFIKIVKKNFDFGADLFAKSNGEIEKKVGDDITFFDNGNKISVRFK
ncbi:MAG: hypothetical protein ACOCWG_04930 [bacterium]